MVDSVDYTARMPIQVLEVPEAAAIAAPTARKSVGSVDLRLRGVVKVIFQTMPAFRSASRPALLRAAKQKGYSEAEFNAALQWLEGPEVAVDVGTAARTMAAPAKAPPPGSESQIQPFDPYAAGKRLAEELKEVEGGAWSGAELQARYGLTSAVLCRRRKEYRILYWRDARHEFHYPRWQFTHTGALLPGIQEVLQLFASADEWRVMSYFLGKRQQLGDRRPLDLLRAGEQDEVVNHAKLHADENTW